VQVLDDEHRRLALTASLHRAPQRGVEPPSAGVRVDPRRGTGGIGDAEELEQQRQLVLEGLLQEHEAPGHLLAGESIAVVLGYPEVRPQHLEHGHQRDALPVRHRAPLVDGDPS
jgi:hypothetical protein